MAKHTRTTMTASIELRIASKAASDHGSWSSGNYANAYQTEDVHAALFNFVDGDNPIERALFIIGFFATYEHHEIPFENVAEFDAAMNLWTMFGGTL